MGGEYPSDKETKSERGLGQITPFSGPAGQAKIGKRGNMRNSVVDKRIGFCSLS
jgi:hypothetical protein